jgi:hypothetical protein
LAGEKQCILSFFVFNYHKVLFLFHCVFLLSQPHSFCSRIYFAFTSLGTVITTFPTMYLTIIIFEEQ